MYEDRTCGAGEDRQGKTRDDLVRAQADSEDRMDQRNCHRCEPADQRREQQHQPVRAGEVLHAPESCDGADQHHPLDSEVEHARTLSQKLANRSEDQGRAVKDG